MKKIIVMVLLSAATWVGMTSVAGALDTALNASVVRVVGEGGGERTIGCAGDEQWNTAVCVNDPVPNSTIIKLR